MKIVLNIGGVYFVTCQETLLSKSCFFSALVRNATQSDEFFIDRDPTHFRFILNHLRGSSFIPSQPDVLKELQIEADFYCLEEMSCHIKDKLKVANAQSVETELRLIRQKMPG